MSDTRPDLSAAYALRTPEDSRRLYRDWAESYEADFIEAHGYRMPGVVARTYLALGGGWPCLDVGCGTGAVARHMPGDAVLDGLDISPEMLAEAEKTGRYRALYEADLTRPLDLPAAGWAGLVSSGTFTTGHVGPAALAPLLAHLVPGGVVAITVKTSFFHEAGFAPVLDGLRETDLIDTPALTEEAIYVEGRAPEGHESDTGLIVTFRRL